MYPPYILIFILLVVILSYIAVLNPYYFKHDGMKMSLVILTISSLIIITLLYIHTSNTQLYHMCEMTVSNSSVPLNYTQDVCFKKLSDLGLTY